MGRFFLCNSVSEMKSNKPMPLDTRLRAMIGFGEYIISATAPFSKNDLIALRNNVPTVVEKLFPDYKKIYQLKNWKMLPGIDRVYVNEKARTELKWKPKYDSRYVLGCIKNGKD